jgi:hypothetical protein
MSRDAKAKRTLRGESPSGARGTPGRSAPLALGTTTEDHNATSNRGSEECLDEAYAPLEMSVKGPA